MLPLPSPSQCPLWSMRCKLQIQILLQARKLFKLSFQFLTACSRGMTLSPSKCLPWNTPTTTLKRRPGAIVHRRKLPHDKHRRVLRINRLNVIHQPECRLEFAFVLRLTDLTFALSD